MAGYDATHSGRSPFAGVRSGAGTPGVTPLWRVATGPGGALATPVLSAAGVLFVGANDGVFRALNASTGAQLWSVATASWIDAAAAITASGNVIFASDDGFLRAVSASTGASVWSVPVISVPASTYTTGDWVRAAPRLAADDTVYMGGASNNLTALDEATGAVKWRYTLPGAGPISTCACVWNGLLFFGSRVPRAVTALNASTGALVWSFTTRGGVHSSPAIGRNGELFFGATDRQMYALSASSGTLLWNVTLPRQVWSSPAVGLDNTVYIGCDDGVLYAFHGANGSIRWSSAASTDGSFIDAAPTLSADGIVYAGSYNGTMYAMDSATGRLLWSFRTSGAISSAAVIAALPGDAQSTLFFASNDSNIWALRATTPTPSPLPSPTRSAAASPLLASLALVLAALAAAVAAV